MPTNESTEQPFVTYLQSMVDNRGALAALRRGLGKPPGTETSMYPHVMRFVSDDTPVWHEKTMFIIAALYASHPMSISSGNMGDHMRACLPKDGDDPALERRFTRLLAAHDDDLPDYLRQAISFLAARDRAVDWHQLYQDILRWGYESRYVQKQWARAYWGRPSQQDNATSNDQDQ